MLNEYSFSDIYIRHAVDERPDDRDFTMHIHEQCEIYFFLSGEVEYLVEGSCYPLTEDTLMIMRPAESHKPRLTGSSRYERYAVNFPLSFASEADPESRLMRAFTQRQLGKGNMYTGAQIDMQLVRRLFSQMCRDDDDYGRQLTIKTHLMTLLDMISRASVAMEKGSSQPNSAAERIVLYVNEHLTEDISVPLLAGRFYLSPSQFSRVFRQATGAAPWEYITRKRLTAAKEMIRGGLSVQKACESCGFGDYSAFYRAYTKYFGCSPGKDNSARRDKY